MLEVGDHCLVVTYHQQAGAVVAASLAHKAECLQCGAWVKAARRLIRKDKLRPVGEGAGQGNTLLLAN